MLRLIPCTFGVFIEGILPSNLKLFNYGLNTLRMKTARFLSVFFERSKTKHLVKYCFKHITKL
uniref:Uncharacterized protein n=1 Tax=Fervidobacterium nodosum TaxID=2424 RepID=A0A7C5U3H6_9BACT